jgi:hypothetical protein
MIKYQKGGYKKMNKKDNKDFKLAEKQANSVIMIITIMSLRVILLSLPLLFILSIGILAGQWNNIDWNITGLYMLIPISIGILSSIISMMRNYRYVTKESSAVLKAARAQVEDSNVFFFKYYKGGDALKNLKLKKMDPEIYRGGYANFHHPKNIWINWAFPLTKREIVNIVAHEMVHLLQMNHYKSNMTIYNHLHFDMGYDRNPMEIEARSVEKRLFNSAERALDSARSILDVYEVYAKYTFKKDKKLIINAKKKGKN